MPSGHAAEKFDDSCFTQWILAHFDGFISELRLWRYVLANCFPLSRLTVIPTGVVT
jgi:hypothetical protein